MNLKERLQTVYPFQPRFDICSEREESYVRRITRIDPPDSTIDFVADLKDVIEISWVNDGTVAYYPGAGKDGALVHLLDGRGIIIYQDPIYKDEPLQGDLASKVRTISDEVKGDEDIQADLVYLKGVSGLLWYDSFGENVMRNTKARAVLIGGAWEISTMGLITENISPVNPVHANITGSYQETEFYRFFRDYRAIMRYILDAVHLGFSLEQFPDLTIEEIHKRANNIFGGYRQDSSFLKRLARAHKREIRKATPEFLDFLGDYVPGFVRVHQTRSFFSLFEGLKRLFPRSKYLL